MNEVWVISEAYDDGIADARRSARWDEVNLREGYFETKEAALARCEELVKRIRSKWVESCQYSIVSDIEQLDERLEVTEGNQFGYGITAVPMRCTTCMLVESYSASVDRIEKHE